MISIPDGVTTIDIEHRNDLVELENLPMETIWYNDWTRNIHLHALKCHPWWLVAGSTPVMTSYGHGHRPV